ncbi:MAG: HPF/RaiA family ribosome-associated protein [Burkholderiales bacterium]|nr:HPF/RaiA family ribosome-associated protein [Burkholderiales bacterium]
MKLPLQIVLRDISHSDAVEADIRARVEKLDRYYPHIMSCRVVVEQPGKHKHQGRPFNVRIDLGVPGGEIVIDREHDEDLYVALRDAFDAARRRLEDYARRQRGEVKRHELEQRGSIARILPEEGYGFIVTADGRELYFSRDNVVHPSFERLKPGMAVTFLEVPASEGLQAKRVSAL